MTKPTTTRVQSVTLALLLAAAALQPALAQDIIGAQPVVTAFIAVLKVIALGGIGWGFMLLMGGRHTLAGLVAMALGGLGIAKAQTIAGLFGL